MNLFDPLRNKKLIDQEEERVRQGLLKEMIEGLGYPKSLLAVEMELSLIPHLTEKKKELPKRRIDILCFAGGINPSFEMYPLLLIECKARKITKAALRQALGYNYYVDACFISLAAAGEIKTFWNDGKRYRVVNFLPSYEELLQKAGALSREKYM